MAAEHVQQGRLFRWLRGRLMWHGWDVLVKTAKARLITIVICTLLIAGVVSGGALEGFWLMKQQSLPGTGIIIGLLFDFLFLTLGMMLIFSGGLILYGSLFSAPEATFLLATPARADQVFGHKFIGAIGFSSWAFILLGVPVLGSYGLIYQVHWLFWLALPLFLLGFVLIPGSIGAVACMAIVNLAPRHRKQLLVLAIAIIVLSIVLLAYRFIMSAIKADVSDRDALSGLLSQLSFARTAWIPSHWMTQGLHAAVRGDYVETLFPLAMVWSNGLILYLVAAFVAKHIYRAGFNRLQTGGDLRKRFGGSRVDRLVEKMLGFLDYKTRLLIIKDFRTFRRDPGQWAQVLIFAGLGLAYFANTRQFYRSDLGRSFQHGVSMVNLLATCLLLCAYMGRFIYPMLSLEGRKFWILGLMPLERSRLLIGKFIFAVVGSIVIAVPLILAADLLLGLPFSAIVLHGLTIVAIATGLSGLAVGIGAILPNFRETDPSKIAVGFGGTMNLLAGLLFLLVEIALISGPYHLQAIMGGEGGGTMAQRWLETGGAMFGIALAVAVSIVPMRLGTKSLEAMEF